MTLLNTSGVLVILTVILLWFVPRSLRRAPAGSAMEPERPLISAERTAEDILASAGVLLNESEAYQSSNHAVPLGTSLPLFCSSAGFFPLLPYGGGIRPACARYGFYFTDSRFFLDCPVHGRESGCGGRKALVSVLLLILPARAVLPCWLLLRWLVWAF